MVKSPGALLGRRLRQLQVVPVVMSVCWFTNGVLPVGSSNACPPAGPTDVNVQPTPDRCPPAPWRALHPVAADYALSPGHGRHPGREARARRRCRCCPTSGSARAAWWWPRRRAPATRDEHPTPEDEQHRARRGGKRLAWRARAVASFGEGHRGSGSVIAGRKVRPAVADDLGAREEHGHAPEASRHTAQNTSGSSELPV